MNRQMLQSGDYQKNCKKESGLRMCMGVFVSLSVCVLRIGEPNVWPGEQKYKKNKAQFF